jgi:hypothetical protein
MAIDLHPDTFWVMPPPNPQFTPFLQVNLEAPTDLDKAIIHNGSRDKFSSFFPVKTLTFLYDTGNSDVVTLKPNPEPQTVTLKHGAKAKQVRIEITAVTQNFDGQEAALTEIELFTKK